MESIDLIRDNLTKSRDRLLVRVEEMREHCLTFPTSASSTSPTTGTCIGATWRMHGARLD